MYNFEVHNELSCKVTGAGAFFSKKGAMVAYEGQFKFSKVLLDTNDTGVVGALVNNVTRRVTGENMEMMKVEGQGSCYLADEAQHVTVLDLQPGEFVLVESENLLAFSDNCKYGVKLIGSGVISQKGLFTTKVAALGYDSKVAIKTDGNPIILKVTNEPIAVDPDAIVCWTGADPHFKLDVNWKTIIGQTSGESYMLEFREPGQVVIVQPTERKSGISLRDTTRPNTQSSPLAGLGGHGNSQGSGGLLGGGSSAQSGGIGDLANMAKNIMGKL